MPEPIRSIPTPVVSPNGPASVRDLRRRWKPAKEHLDAAQASHPTAVRMHRAFSWLARAEQADGELDLILICRWIAFNALYGRWNERAREPLPDRECWRTFLDRILGLDRDGHVTGALTQHKQLVFALLDDEYVSSFFWQEPSSPHAKRCKKAKFQAQAWYVEKRWPVILDCLLERVYLIRCQLVHGAATYQGKLNRDSLRRCSTMLGHLLQAVLLVLIDYGTDEDWGQMCYPPLRRNIRPR